MATRRKPLERRTFSQDRYYILIKRQKAGTATFNELEELDEIVNRDATIREKVILESLEHEELDNLQGPDQGDRVLDEPVRQSIGVIKWMRSILDRIENYFLLPVTGSQCF
jgi:hypothetical protein